MSHTKQMQKALQSSKTTIAELVYVCEELSRVITEENFVETEHSTNSDNIFNDSVKIRTIESWISKIAYDHYANRRGEARAFKVSEVIDIKIREFADSLENQARIETLLRRKLTPLDVIRLLWVGDQGLIFTKRFMVHFVTHLKQHGIEKAIRFSEDD